MSQGFEFPISLTFSVGVTVTQLAVNQFFKVRILDGEQKRRKNIWEIKMKKESSPIEIFAHKATRWIGTTNCLVFHGVFFLIAFTITPFIGLDRVLLVTTTLLSWEAIFIGIFLQMSINRHGERIEDIEADIDDILEDTEDLTEEDTAE